ncbi:metal-dependent phosphohydrolase, partial [mine drainage metagenome]
RLRKNGIQKVSVEVPTDKEDNVKQDAPPETLNGQPDTIHNESIPPPEEGSKELPEPLTKELSEIERIQKETALVLEGSFHEARMGRAMDTKKIREMVRQTIDLILQNKSSTSFLADISGNDDETFVHSANTMMLAVGYAIKKKIIPEEEWMSWGMAASLHD